MFCSELMVTYVISRVEDSSLGNESPLKHNVFFLLEQDDWEAGDGMRDH